MVRIDAPALDPARGTRRYAPGARNAPWNAPLRARRAEARRWRMDPALLQTIREKCGGIHGAILGEVR